MGKRQWWASGGILQVISRIRLLSDLWVKGRLCAFALRDGGDFAEREGGIGHRDDRSAKGPTQIGSFSGGKEPATFN